MIYMEDAMILNKSSVEHGMFHGQIYQVEYLHHEHRLDPQLDHLFDAKQSFRTQMRKELKKVDPILRSQEVRLKENDVLPQQPVTVGSLPEEEPYKSLEGIEAETNRS